MAEPQRLKLRVYYEDTDFSGRVYHASYLRFLERGRTEWLRALGLQHARLHEQSRIAFAVTAMRIEFVRAAGIDDVLEAVTELEDLRGPRLTFRQTILRDGEVVVAASVEVVTLKDGRAARPPTELRQALGAMAEAPCAGAEKRVRRSSDFKAIGAKK